MSQNEFINQPRFHEILNEAVNLKGKVFSDIIDDEGLQYVDLVQEGGGVLGIALVGYTYVLEEAGIRFFHLAGTSAGAINTLVMGGTGKIDEAKSGLILQVLADQNLFDFVDGDPALKAIVQKLVDGTPVKRMIWRLLKNIGKIKRALFDDLGLNPGIKFESWLSEVLSNAGPHVRTIGELMELRGKSSFPAGLKHRTQGKVEDEFALLHIITADVTTQTKVQFPQMGHLYWGDKMPEISPSRMVRASMSVPFFFTPFEIDNIPGAGSEADGEWIKYAGYHGKIPQKVKFVDGGMLSNFPINVFHVSPGVVPRKPTFGVRLSTYRDEYANVSGLFGFIGSMVSTMRRDSDDGFLINNPDFNKLICFIDADKDFKWLNFNMSLDRQQKLFLLGAEKALAFLKQFDWEAYKKIRMNT